MNIYLVDYTFHIQVKEIFTDIYLIIVFGLHTHIILAAIFR